MNGNLVQLHKPLALRHALLDESSNSTDIRVQVDAVNETIWLNQKGIAELFGVTIPAINQHLKNIYSDGELNEDSTIKKNLIVQQQ